MCISRWPAGIVAWCWSNDAATFAFDFVAIVALLTDTSTRGHLVSFGIPIVLNTDPSCHPSKTTCHRNGMTQGNEGARFRQDWNLAGNRHEA